SGGITYLVDRLAERGLVRRQACETDRRATYAVLTDAGTALMEEIFPLHASAIEDAVAGLDAPEQERATALLRELGLTADAKAPAATAPRSEQGARDGGSG